MNKLNNSAHKLNNARIACYGFACIYDYQKVEGDIWVGRVLIDRNLSAQKKLSQGQPIFFSRLYDKENDQDRMLHEYDVKDEDIIGVPFLLVPSDKLLFLYEPPSTIVKAPLKISKRFG